MGNLDYLAQNLEDTIQKIEKARLKVSDHHIVKLVAISKYSSVEAIKKLYELGQRAFGENQVQQLQERVEELNDLPLQWHMVGRLQKNKINKLIDLNPFLLQSLDSIELADALNMRLENKNSKMRALLQINSAKEQTKAGVMPEEAIDVYAKIVSEYPNIELRGVMSIGAHTDDKKEIQKSFETTYKIYEQVASKYGASICSMGMSSDFELAIECGSNMVRVGSTIFGK